MLVLNAYGRCSKGSESPVKLFICYDIVRNCMKKTIIVNGQPRKLPSFKLGSNQSNPLSKCVESPWTFLASY